MAGLGFKDFQVGEVLTSADVDGYLMQQTVMRFADAGARGSALGTATGTGVPLAEGMVSYLDDANTLELFDGTAWRGVGGFDSVATITATDASWSVPTLADPVVRVTVVGGGGGGGGADNSGTRTAGAAGGTTTFACSAGTATAVGGFGGNVADTGSSGGANANDGFAAGNHGEGSINGSLTGLSGGGGAITIAYYDLTGVTTASVTIGAGGAGGLGGAGGGDGGDGVVIVEYRAG